MQNDLIIYEQQGNGGCIGVISLNMPSRLNAVNLDNVKLIHKKLCQWDSDSNIKAILIRSHHESFFCSGGDLKSIYNNDFSYAKAKFWHEYRLIAKINSLSKPYIALINGITMGGGVGLGINGRFCISATNLTFAMPETSIGFFPDVGASYFLPKAPGKTGLYLGLTGCSITADDALFCGFIDYIVEYKNFSQIVADINKTNLDSNSEEKLQDIFNHYALPKHEGNLEQRFQDINNTFDIPRYNSPNSLRVTEKLLTSNSLSFNSALQQEFQLACNFFKAHDFKEGIRAKIITKDNKPSWQDHHDYSLEHFFQANEAELKFNDKDIL